jgi:hypothetical protein
VPNPAVPNPAVPTVIELPDLKPLIDKLKFKCKHINDEYKKYNALLSSEIKTQMVEDLNKKGREGNKKQRYIAEIHYDYVKFQMNDGTVGFEPVLSFIKAAHAIKLKEAYDPYFKQVNAVKAALKLSGTSEVDLKTIGQQKELDPALKTKIENEINGLSVLSEDSKIKLIEFMTANKNERKEKFGNFKGLDRSDPLTPPIASAMGMLVQRFTYVEKMFEVIDQDLEVKLKKLEPSAIKKIVFSLGDMRHFAFASFKELLKIYTINEMLHEATLTSCQFGKGLNSPKYIGITVKGEDKGNKYEIKKIIGLYFNSKINSDNKHLMSGGEKPKLRFFKDPLDVHYFGGLPFSCYFSNQWSGESDKNNRDFPNFQTYIEKVSKGRFSADRLPDPDNSGEFLYQLIDIGVQNQPLNQILYGPPGSGKTYNAVNHALSIALKKDLKSLIEFQKGNDRQRESDKEDFDGLLKDGQIRFVTFHQSYSYEDFVEGIKPRVVKNNIEYRVEPGVFKQICRDASCNPEKNYVLIIDEINRGNISKIFGELITLIEDSKRIGNPEELSLNLVYSRSGTSQVRFGVPKNVYIIGTMNTADKSIALVDLALRRRFTFIEYPADPTLLEETTDGIDLKLMLTRINERIEFLLDKEHSIGHSYLMGKKNKDEVLEVFRDKIIPLLSEYFYNDFKKISWVLGDRKELKDPDFFLVSKKVLILKDIFGFEPEGEFEGKEDEIYEFKLKFDKLKIELLLGIYLGKEAVESKMKKISEIKKMKEIEEIAVDEEDDDDDDDDDFPESEDDDQGDGSIST